MQKLLKYVIISVYIIEVLIELKWSFDTKLSY